jgi:hypothetical protein
MAEKKKWDLTSTHSLQGAAHWIRSRSGAAVVLVVREQDWAADVDPSLLPQDACAKVNQVMAELYAMILERKAKGKR